MALSMKTRSLLEEDPPPELRRTVEAAPAEDEAPTWPEGLMRTVEAAEAVADDPARPEPPATLVPL